MINLRVVTKLYTKRQQQKRDLGYFNWEPYHREYLLRFWQQQKKAIIKVGGLSFLAIAVEVFIFVVARVVVRQLSLQLKMASMWHFIFALSVAILMYLLLSYFSIFFQKKLLIDLLNSLRSQWFKIVLRGQLLTTKTETKESIMAKVSYHFSLVTMGFNSALLGTLRAILIAIVVLLLSAFISWQMLLWGGLAIAISLLLAFLGYKVAYNYVSREQTFYTQIVKPMLRVFYDLSNYQLHGREALAVKKFDSLVRLDSWFRVRRDIWMKYGGEILFVLILLGGAFLYIIQLYWPHVFRQEVSSLFFYGVVITYIIRLFYLSLRAGLFYVPLRLGLWLSIPDKKPAKSKKTMYIENICFRSEKFKLLDGDSYYEARWCFQKGGSYLFIDKNRERLDVLARLFSGFATHRVKPWLLSINNKRYLYKDYFKYRTTNYLISPLWHFQGTVGEFLLNKEGGDIRPSDIEIIYGQLAQHKAWHFIFKHSKALVKDVSDVATSIETRGLLQVAYAIVHKLNFIIVDSSLIDLRGEDFQTAIKLLRSQVAGAIILIMSIDDNQLLNYDEKLLLQTK